MKTSRSALLIFRLALLLAILAGLGWYTHPTAAQPPTCQMTTLASEVTYDAPQISGGHVLWTNSEDNTITLYTIDTGETVILNEEGVAIWPQLSGNYVLMPDRNSFPHTVRLYDIAAKTETVILEDFGQPVHGLNCLGEAQCGSIYYDVEYQLVDPIILVYGHYPEPFKPIDIFVYDIATQTLDPLPIDFTIPRYSLTIATDGQTVVWIAPLPSDETHPSYANVMRYDIATKTATPLTTETLALQVALNGSRIAWLYLADGIETAIDVYDMDDGNIRTLPVSPIGDAYLMLTGDYAVWGSVNPTTGNLIEVYNLRLDATFTVLVNDDNDSSGMGFFPRASSHALVWEVAYRDSEGYPLTSKVFYYDLANRTQTTLTHTAPHAQGPSISQNYVVWSGDYNDWEHPYLKDDVYLAVCETNLMVNGTFEANEDGKVKLPDGWQGVGALKGDRELTDTPQKTLAYSPPHAFQFKGFTGEQSRIVSKADLRGHEMAKGDVLTLSAMVDQRSGVPGAQIVRATVKFADGKQQTYRLRLSKLKIAGYVQLSVSRPLKFDNVKQIKVEVFYQKPSGKFIIDDVKLLLTKADATPALIPVPDAP